MVLLRFTELRKAIPQKDMESIVEAVREDKELGVLWSLILDTIESNTTTMEWKIAEGLERREKGVYGDTVPQKRILGGDTGESRKKVKLAGSSPARPRGRSVARDPKSMDGARTIRPVRAAHSCPGSLHRTPFREFRDRSNGTVSKPNLAPSREGNELPLLVFAELPSSPPLPRVAKKAGGIFTMPSESGHLDVPITATFDRSTNRIVSSLGSSTSKSFSFEFSRPASPSAVTPKKSPPFPRRYATPTTRRRTSSPQLPSGNERAVISTSKDSRPKEQKNQKETIIKLTYPFNEIVRGRKFPTAAEMRKAGLVRADVIASIRGIGMQRREWEGLCMNLFGKRATVPCTRCEDHTTPKKLEGCHSFAAKDGGAIRGCGSCRFEGVSASCEIIWRKDTVEDNGSGRKKQSLEPLRESKGKAATKGEAGQKEGFNDYDKNTNMNQVLASTGQPVMTALVPRASRKSRNETEPIHSYALRSVGSRKEKSEQTIIGAAIPAPTLRHGTASGHRGRPARGNSYTLRSSARTNPNPSVETLPGPAATRNGPTTIHRGRPLTSQLTRDTKSGTSRESGARASNCCNNDAEASVAPSRTRKLEGEVLETQSSTQRGNRGGKLGRGARGNNRGTKRGAN